MAETQMMTPWGTRTIVRPHTRPDSPLRGWSAADLLAFEKLVDAELGSVLVVNDEFGALTVGLADHRPTVWSDSIMSRAAIDANLATNGLEPLGERAISGDHDLDGRFDTVIVRIPKTSALLNHQLTAIRHHVGTKTRIIGAGMVRHIHRSTIDSFATMFGLATTTLAKRKARLIVAEVDAATIPAAAAPVFPTFVTKEHVTVSTGPGVFSAGHLDVGTTLLLETLGQMFPVPPAAGTAVADLGCGNGVIGATLARRWLASKFVLVDVSDLAVATAKRTWAANDLPGAQARIEVADGLTPAGNDSLDLVVTNPPFHHGHALDHELTDRLMADAARALRPDGQLVVVAQRHLNMHTRLLRWFGEAAVPSKHPSHVVVVASGPKAK